MVQQHVLLSDRGKHVAVEIGDPLGHARREGRPEQVGALVQDQFAERGDADHPVDLDHLAAVDVELAHHRLQELGLRALGVRHPHHFPPAAALQRNLELAHEILGLFLQFEVAVAQDTELEIGPEPVAREQAFDLE